MCNFKSAIVIKDEQVNRGYRLLMSPWTESHTELCQIHKLNDTASAKLYFARVEFSPPSMEQAYLVNTYKLKIDEERCPDWFDEEMKERVTEQMTAYIKTIIVDGDVDLLIGGQFIIAPNANVKCAKVMVINAMCGGTLTEMCGGTLTKMYGGTLTNMYGGTLTKMCGGTLTNMYGGTLTEMCGGTLTKMYGGTLTKMCGGLIQEVTEYYTLLIGKINKPGKILKDNRTKK
jgi:hypothetical protein